MKAILKAIDGNKTYIGMIAAGALGISWNYGLVNDEIAGLLATLITTWTGISLRSAMKKLEIKPATSSSATAGEDSSTADRSPSRTA
jgi:hypothetical protein